MITKIVHTTILSLLLLTGIDTLAQNRRNQRKDQQQWNRESQLKKNKTIQQGWTKEISFGIDFLSNLLINPAVGGGESRLGINGAIDANVEYQEERFSWYGFFSMNYGIQKSGTGPVSDTVNIKAPFQKNIDNIWVNSRAALRTSYFSKFYYTVDLFFNSQLTNTYDGNFLSDVNQVGAPISGFLAPGMLQFSAGIDYKHNDYVSVFFTPASVKAIFVLEDNIANDVAFGRNGEVLGTIHGNPYTENPDGTLTFQNTDFQLGAALRAVYENQITPKITLRANLLLFSNYLKAPDHIDINFRNELSITIVKGLNLSLLSFLTYDHDVFVQISDNTQPGGVNGLGRRISYNQQFLLKYSYVIK